MSIAEKLLTDFRDMLQDHERVKEPSDGLIYRRFTEAQNYFMADLRISKLPYYLVLWEGQDEYPIPDNIVEIVDIHFSREELNPYFEFVNMSSDTMRYIKITSPGAAETDSSAMIRTGDVITLDVFWKPDDDRLIDAENEPLVEKQFRNLLVDWALSYYTKYNKTFKTLDTVKLEARLKKNRMYGVNSIKSIDINFVRF